MFLKFLSVCTLVLVGLVCANLEGEGSLRGDELKGVIEGVINATLNTVINKIPDPLIIPQFNTVLENQTLATYYKWTTQGRDSLKLIFENAGEGL